MYFPSFYFQLWALSIHKPGFSSSRANTPEEACNPLNWKPPLGTEFSPSKKGEKAEAVPHHVEQGTSKRCTRAGEQGANFLRMLSGLKNSGEGTSPAWGRIQGSHFQLGW